MKYGGRVALAVLALLAAGGVFWWRQSRPAPELDGIKAEVRAKFPDVKQLSTAELAAWLSDPSREPPVLLDARGHSEYAVSHLAGARNVRHQDVPEDLAKDKPIVAYCSVGYRSSMLARRMQEAGFTRVSNLEGSIFQWANEGREVVRGETPVREVHPYDESWGRLLIPERRAKTP